MCFLKKEKMQGDQDKISKFKKGVNIFQCQLSEKDGDVFDMGFLRPPSFFSPPGVFEVERDPEIPASFVPIQEIEGLCLLKNMMTRDECLQIIDAAEAIGFQETKGIGPATKTGLPCPPKCVYVLQTKDIDQIFNRVRHLLPQKIRFQKQTNEGEESGETYVEMELAGINPRFRLHRYLKGFTLGPHFDRGNYYGSGVDEDQELRLDIYGDSRVSQMSLLIFLNDDFSGGETTFFPHPENLSMKLQVTPCQGTGVAFFHGDHPMSPYHEGSIVNEGSKYIIRTDILYRHV